MSAFQSFHSDNSTLINAFDETKCSCFTLLPTQKLKICLIKSSLLQENAEKIKVNKTLPYLVSNVIEVRIFLAWCLSGRTIKGCVEESSFLIEVCICCLKGENLV